jgi:tetratricopeptide (TPR) repeat protein
MQASPEQVLAQLQESYELVAAEPFTGDASLDVFLLLLPEEDRRLAIDLSVPHWFNLPLASAVADRESSDITPHDPWLRDIPFLRSHPRGVAYHDAAREAMRGFLLRREPSRVREVCRRLSTFLEMLVDADPSEEEIQRELIYSRLAHDESAAMSDLVAAFNQARKGMRRAACDQLLALAEEQDALLEASSHHQIVLLRAKLAFDQHQHEQALSLLERLPSDLPEPLDHQVVLIRGRILEAEEQWQEAETLYRQAVERNEAGPSCDLTYMARLYHRRAAANLGMKKLGAAERYVRISLDINTKSHDKSGTGLNLDLLGEIYERLGDSRFAQKLFEQSLDLLDHTKNQSARLVALTNLARLYQARRQFSDAERYYRAAINERSAAGDTYGLGILYSDLGWLELQRGHMPEAMAEWELSCKSFRTMRDPTRVAQVLNLMAKGLAATGHYPEAVAQQEDALRLLPESSELRPEYEADLQQMREEAAKPRTWWRRSGRRLALATFVVTVMTALVTLILDTWQ